MKLWPTLFFSLLFALPVSAQGDDPADKEHTKVVQLTADPGTVKVGETFILEFKLKVDAEWHIYSANGTMSPTHWVFAAGLPIERVGEVQEPKPKHHSE